MRYLFQKVDVQSNILIVRVCCHMERSAYVHIPSLFKDLFLLPDTLMIFNALSDDKRKPHTSLDCQNPKL